MQAKQSKNSQERQDGGSRKWEQAHVKTRYRSRAMSSASSQRPLSASALCPLRHPAGDRGFAFGERKRGARADKPLISHQGQVRPPSALERWPDARWTATTCHDRGGQANILKTTHTRSHGTYCSGLVRANVTNVLQAQVISNSGHDDMIVRPPQSSKHHRRFALWMPG